MITAFELILFAILASCLSLLTGEKWGRPDDIARPALNTTIVVLNWSRLANVNKILSGICRELLRDTVHSAIVWNNSPRALSYESDFQNTLCPKDRLRIINSPENLYFQARFMGCAEATTPYCFIQDDDFLVLPEIIRALSLRANNRNISAIHLQPPDEMLTSHLRSIEISDKIQTTFAWLGYGTIIQRSMAIEFLSLLKELDMTDEEHKMADNYFTILGNEIPERWFDQGIELGGGQPFTVGTAGEERNLRHIIRAAQLLDRIVSKGGRHLHYTALEKETVLPSSLQISRAPCHYSLCVFETSIKLLPDDLISPTFASTEIISLERTRLQNLGEQRKFYYLKFPPSNAVDGNPLTTFRSPRHAQGGDWISLDMLQHALREVPIDVVLLINPETEIILRNSVFESSDDGFVWISWEPELLCKDSSPSSSDSGHADSQGWLPVRSCRTPLKKPKQYTRVRLLRDVGYRWGLHEFRVESSPKK